MTDARMPGRWLYDPALDGLSDRAWRTYVGSLMWSAEQGTDGHLPIRALRLLHPEGVDDTTAAELVAASRWEALPDGYQVTGWGNHQSMAVDVEWQRERNRRNVAASRARSRGDVSGYVSGDVSDNAVGQDRQGKDALRDDPAGNVSGDACGECQRRRVFNSGPCPRHQVEAIA